MWECVCDGDCRAATCQLPPPPGSPVLSSQGELTAPAEQDWVPAVVTPSHPPPATCLPLCACPRSLSFQLPGWGCVAGASGDPGRPLAGRRRHAQKAERTPPSRQRCHAPPGLMHQGALLGLGQAPPWAFLPPQPSPPAQGTRVPVALDNSRFGEGGAE